jgi:hypothetical protein
VIEIVGTYALVALYASIAISLARARERSSPGRAEWLPLVLLVAAFTSFTLGHGIHVAANSIHDLLGDGHGDPAVGLAYFWDERAGHVPVDLGRVLFVVALCALESGAARPPAAVRRRTPSFALLGAAAYGFIYFATAVEGQTVPLALPFSAGLLAWGLRERRRAGGSGPVAAFFTAAAIVSLLFFLFYGIWQRGFPEFTRAGIL